MTLQQLANKYGKSRERIRRIVFQQIREGARIESAKHRLAVCPTFEDIPIDALTFPKPLDVRIKACLRYDGIKTLGQVLAMTDGELLRIPNLGARSLAELKRIIAALRSSMLMARSQPNRQSRVAASND